VSSDGLGSVPHQGGRGREEELLPSHVWYDTRYLCTHRNDSAILLEIRICAYICIHMRSSVLNLMLPNDFVSYIMFMYFVCATYRYDVSHIAMR
jgi:hypothetical protein